MAHDVTNEDNNTPFWWELEEFRFHYSEVVFRIGQIMLENAQLKKKLADLEAKYVGASWKL